MTIKNIKFTLIGFVLSVTLLIVVLVFNLELFEFTIEGLARLEDYEVDEFIIPTLLLFGFIFMDVNHKHKVAVVEAEKAKIYKAMIASVQHVLNNFLNQLLIIKMEAESTPSFDPEVLAMYDEIILEAQEQIKQLSSVVSIDEDSIKNSVKPK